MQSEQSSWSFDLNFRRVSYHDSAETVQMRLHKSLKLWSLYADLEESFGTFKVMLAWSQMKNLAFATIFVFSDDESRVRPDTGTENRQPTDHHQLRLVPQREQLFRGGFQSLRKRNRSIQVAKCLWHLEHVSDGIFTEVRRIWFKSFETIICRSRVIIWLAESSKFHKCVILALFLWE